jgi:tetratricopeptide (TPR) repeat protein
VRFLILSCILLVAAAPSHAFLMLQDEAGEVELTLEAADERFDAGDYPAALTLYDQLLAAEPDNAHALMRSGLLHSWEGRYEEALTRYARLLTVDPGNRSAARERAKVLSWASRFDESIAAWRDYLERYPDDREARTAYARVLSWNRRFPESREQYQLVLAGEPENVDCLVGVARTHAWAGEVVEAREWYERALAVDPQSKDAQLGVAYLDLWSGDGTSALRAAKRLDQRYPDDPDVQEFVRRAREASGPSVRASADTLSDTDDNDMRIYRLAVDWGLPAGVGMTAGYDRHDMTDPLGDASIDTLYLSALYRINRRQSLGARLGVDRRTETTGETANTTIGGLVYTWGLDHPWRVTASANRDSLRYSPVITDNGIVINDYIVRADGKVKGPWRVFSGAGLGDFSDGNRRTRAWAGFAYRWNISTLVLDTGYRFDFMDFSDSPGNGYFSPQDFTANLLQAHGSGTYGTKGGTYNFTVDTGFQSFTNQGVETTNDFVIVIGGAVGHPLGRGFRIEGFALWGNYAAGSATGFESRQLGLRLRWSGGN